MAASYPNSAKSFTTKSNGGTIDASHINDLQEEVTAVENDLIAGLPVARGGTGNTSLVANRIPYGNGSSALQSSANLTFDGSTFTTAAIVATTITPSGAVNISGAAAGQIVFPASQNASANANTLDDYEEGTWTPAIGGSGGQSGQAYSVQVGRYVKVGKLVTAYFQVVLSTLGTVTTNAQVQGLPFTTENVTNQRVPLHIGYFSGLTSNVVWISGYADPNTTAAFLTIMTAAQAFPSNALQADLSDTTRLVGSITYVATA